jgi:enoyl-CoA hydratase
VENGTEDRPHVAGADISEMRDLTFGSAYTTNFIASWSAAISTLAKPLIAAVNGHALGGGCELAMMADILYCSAAANFGQPEITLGTIPGAGGSQRLTRAIGKSRAMEMILTGKMIDGRKAEQWGLAAQCFETAEECVEGAMTTATKIASLSRVATKAAKEVVNKSQELSLREGIDYERRLFHGLFGSEDQKIGMNAFISKDRHPKWTHK